MAKPEGSETTTIRLKPSARAALDKFAAADKRSRSFLVQQIVEEWLQNRAEAAKPAKARKVQK
jgi:predicted transcriptional regulator